MEKEKLKYEDLFQTKSFASWKDFITEFMSAHYCENMLWRGQGNSSWEILSSYTRDVENKIKRLSNPTENISDKKNSPLALRYECAQHISFDYYNLIRLMPKENNPIEINPLQELLNPKITMKDSHYVRLFKFFSYFKDKQKDMSENDYTGQFGSMFDITFATELELSQWAWGQHYGVKTPLVDWTRYALYALFFALDGWKPENDEINVFSLNIHSLSRINESIANFPVESIPSLLQNKDPKEIKTSKHFIDTYLAIMFNELPIPSFSFKQPQVLLQEDDQNLFHYREVFADMAKMKLILPIGHTHQNLRLQSQGGFFTFTPSGISVENWCKRIIEARKEESLNIYPGMKINPLIVKYNIGIKGKKEKQECLAFLENANITAKTVYPDFQGLSKYIAYKSEPWNLYEY